MLTSVVTFLVSPGIFHIDILHHSQFILSLRGEAFVLFSAL